MELNREPRNKPRHIQQTHFHNGAKLHTQWERDSLKSVMMGKVDISHHTTTNNSNNKLELKT